MDAIILTIILICKLIIFLCMIVVIGIILPIITFILGLIDSFTFFLGRFLFAIVLLCWIIYTLIKTPFIVHLETNGYYSILGNMLSTFNYYLFDDIFGFFKFNALVCSIMVVNSRNPVHAVLFLILVFLNVAPIFLVLKSEFLALSLIIVYVGAIAVLFLFVVMLLDIRMLDKRRGLVSYYIPGVIAVISLAFIFHSFLTGYYYPLPTYAFYDTEPNVYSNVLGYSNLQVLGIAIFSYYPIFLLLASCILMIAVIGSVVLTSLPANKTDLTTKKKQDIFTQVFYESRIYFFKKKLLIRYHKQI